MKREIDMDEISDGRRYRSGDMVKIGCSECAGCFECCTLTDDTIILDPYDMFELCRGLDTTFDALLSGETGTRTDTTAPEASPVIELGLADGILLPHLKVDPGKGCSFLNETGRCSIHGFRPGFCRLYPLGRIYEDGSFSYFLQVNECPYPNKTKVKIKKWLGIDSLPEYEAFVLKWHDVLEETRREASLKHEQTELSHYLVSFLKRYYRTPYDTDGSFYEQFRDRLNQEMTHDTE